VPIGPWMYIFLSMDAALVNHHSGFSGCRWVWLLVFAIDAHGGGWTWSRLSFMCLARRWMNIDAGTLCGVGKFGSLPRYG